MDSQFWMVMIAGMTLVCVLLAGMWTLMRSQFDVVNRDISRLIADVQRIDVAFNPAFREFKERVLKDLENMREQIHILEQTRPTTGELQAMMRK